MLRPVSDVPDYFRTHKPRLLAAWGKNDPFFLPRGAEAFRRDIPSATVHFFDTGHFALETHAKEIGAADPRLSCTLKEVPCQSRLVAMMFRCGRRRFTRIATYVKVGIRPLNLFP